MESVLMPFYYCHITNFVKDVMQNLQKNQAFKIYSSIEINITVAEIILIKISNAENS